MVANQYNEQQKGEIIAEICEKIAEGASVRTLLLTGRDARYPSFGVFNAWLSEKPEWTQQYARAMELRADLLFEQMQEIADTVEPLEAETITHSDQFGRSVMVNKKDDPNHRKLRVETRKWIVSRMNPKKYGDKLDLTSKGEQLPAPVYEITFGDGSGAAKG